MWPNSSYVIRQIDKIGKQMSTALVKAGVTSFEHLRQMDARRIEVVGTMRHHRTLAEQTCSLTFDIARSFTEIRPLEIRYTMHQISSCIDNWANSIQISDQGCCGYLANVRIGYTSRKYLIAN